jgi:hypothetical protein
MTNLIRTTSLSAAAFLVASCGANEGILKSGRETPSTNLAAPSTASAFEQDLASMQTADFRWVYVLRRKDGGVMDADDRSVIKLNTGEANRRMSSDSDKAFIIGTNTPIAPANMLKLYGRFSVEDHSPEPPPANVTGNSNSNK